MSKIKIAAVCLAILCTLSGCQQKAQTEETKTVTVDTHSLVPESTLAFDIDKETSLNNYFYDICKINGEDFLGLVNRNKNGIQFYSIADRKLYKKIEFPEEGPDGFPRLRAFTFVNPDSIFIINLYSKDLWLTDIEGHIKKKYNAMNNGQNLFNLGSGFYTGLKPIFYKGKLYIHSFSKASDSFNPSFFDSDNKLEMEIDIKNETWKFLDITYPDVYEGNVWIGDLSRDLSKDGNIIYSFAIDPAIRKYRIANGSITSYKSESSFIKHFQPLDMNGDQESMARYFVESPRYTNMVYDKFNDVYYRFVRHELPTVNPRTGEKNTHDDAPFSIVIMDGTFNKIGETKIDETKHHINSYFLTKDGLYISNTNPRNPDLSEDVLAFTLFKLKKTN